MGRYEEAMVATFDGVQPEATKQDKRKMVQYSRFYVVSHETRLKCLAMPLTTPPIKPG